MSNVPGASAAVLKGPNMKKPISATIEERLIQWMDSELKDGLTYRNKSHLIEVALIGLKEKAEQKKR